MGDLPDRHLALLNLPREPIVTKFSMATQEYAREYG
ncbi:hypothetical protein ACVWWG_009179, partial [Bradyrhizobium sp. LB7.2]